MSEEYTSGSYRMEMLKSSNWMPWKRRMLAVLRDLGLEQYIAKDASVPGVAKAGEPTAEELEAQKKWRDGDAKAHTRMELAISDAEMIHISGAIMASDMWKHLSQVKKSKGHLGVLATRRALYRASAIEGFNMVDHISNLRKLQQKLHLMESLITDEDFVMILITSVPESWDNYTSAYLGSSGNKPTLTSHELIAILLEEDRRRKGRIGDSAGTTLHVTRHPKMGSHAGKQNKNPDIECYNCHKKGHMSHDCWEKGGRREGLGPKGRKGPNRGNRSNQAQEANANLNEVAYTATNQSNKYDWYFDTATTSHICNQRDTFIDYYPLENSTISGIGPNPALADGRGTIIINCSVDGKIIPHRLSNVLHVPNAANSLLSGTRFDEAGGTFIGGNEKCILKDNKGRVLGKGNKVGRLYLMDARSQSQERTNFSTTTQKQTWDQWHKNFGHIATPSLERLHRENMVNGMIVDQSSSPSKSCDICIQAKQARHSYPKEAEHCCRDASERIMSDVWGPAQKISIGGWKYYISFTDNATRYVHVLFLADKSQAFDRIKERVAQIKRQFGKVLKYMCFDNGKELVNEKLRKFTAEEGIIIETSAPYSPSQGVAERFNRTLLELARAMIIGRNVPQFLWDEAVAHAAYLRNHAPTRALEGKTPYEAFHKLIPNVAHLREFGSEVWIFDESIDKSKLAPKSNKMMFVGFIDGLKSVRYYDAKTRKIKVSRNFTFTENGQPDEIGEMTKIPSLQAEGEILNITPSQTSPKNTSSIPTTQEQPLEEPRKLRERTTAMNYRKMNNPMSRTPIFHQTTPLQSPIPTIAPDITTSMEASKANSNSQEKANLALEALMENLFLNDHDQSYRASDRDVPKSMEEALDSAEAENWKKAMEIEMETLGKMGTWVMVLTYGRFTRGKKSRRMQMGIQHQA